MNNIPLVNATAMLEDRPALEGDNMQSADSEATASQKDLSNNTDSFSQALAIYCSNSVDVEHYRRQTTVLAQQLADQKFEAEETAYHVGCLVLQSIEAIKHLAAVQTREAAVEAALNGLLNHAHRHGVALEYPPVDREMRQRRAHRRPGQYFTYTAAQANPTWEYHSQARRLGMDFSMDPSVIIFEIIIEEDKVNELSTRRSVYSDGSKPPPEPDPQADHSVRVQACQELGTDAASSCQQEPDDHNGDTGGTYSDRPWYGRPQGTAMQSQARLTYLKAEG
ncbi:hypothetical protein BKA70DRAFT_1222851 [Coprinopsis sp. MPI-PUGE-AT-0042]|nr:hypothetical protein BKA70DRAFT_1222851 [Coprinopsis sp. MPI-PUGE-AT-0042]